MSASLRSKTQNSSSKSQKKKPDAEMRTIVAQPSREPLPMRRHKGLFVALMSVFVAWVGVMLGMYVMTVRPQRHLEPLPLPPQSPQPPAGATTTTSPTTRALAQTLVPPSAAT